MLRGGRRRNSGRELRQHLSGRVRPPDASLSNWLFIQFCRIFGQSGNSRSLCHRYRHRIYFLIKTITFCRKFTYLL